MTFADRERAPVEALLVDHYLEALLASRVPSAPDPRLDPAVAATAQRLSRELVRIHPSFRFEERLARRLAEFAAGRTLAAAAGAEGALVPFPGAGEPTGLLGTGTPGDPETATLAAIVEGRLDPSALVGVAGSRPILLGGAMASAVLSLAGVVLVAWRATHPQPPMRRAVRALHRARPRPARQTALRGRLS